MSYSVYFSNRIVLCLYFTCLYGGGTVVTEFIKDEALSHLSVHVSANQHGKNVYIGIKRLNFLLAARCLLVCACCSLLFSRCSLLFARCSLPFGRCLLFFGCCSLLFGRSSLLFARCSLHSARCSLLFGPSYVKKV